MFFDYNWRKTRHKALRNYAAYRLPNYPEVFLITKLPWLIGIHLFAVGLGIRTDASIPWWTLCILPCITTGLLIFSYYRERDRDIVGFFRYNSAFYSLVGLSMIELSIAYSIYAGVPSAGIGAFLIGMILFASMLLWLRKKIDENYFSENNQHGAGAAGLAGVLGYGTYFICKQVFSEQALFALMAIVGGALAAMMFGASVGCWLKSVGADDPNR